MSQHKNNQFKNILVYAGIDKGYRSRLRLATDLAKQFNAHLTALHIVPQAIYTPYVAMQFPVDVYDSLQQHETKINNELRDIFHETVAQKEINNYEWEQINSTIADGDELLVSRTFYQDLLIIPQRAHKSEHDNHITPEASILKGAAPLIVTPEDTGFSAEHANVAIAWNASQQAARAVHSALPLIRAAAHVHVFIADGDRELPHSLALDHAKSIRKYFKNHDIKITLHQEKNTDNAKIGDIMLNFIAKHNINLLVMGGYSHLRLTEALLGGASYDLLSHSPIPVFISH